MPNVSPSGRDLAVVAQAMLKAAEELGFNPNVVQTHGDGVYGMGLRAPVEIVETFHLFLDESQDPIHVEVPASDLPVPVNFDDFPDEDSATVIPIVAKIPNEVMDKILADPDKAIMEIHAQEPVAEQPVKRGPGRPKKETS